MMYEVELSWREHGVYEVEADNEDNAIAEAITQAKRESISDPQHFDVEAVGEAE